MDKRKTLAWVNKLAKATKKLAAIEDLNKDFSWCKSCVHKPTDVPYVHIHRGLFKIAKLLDVPVTVDYETETDICYVFTYDGVDFIQLVSKEDDEDGE